MARPGSTRPATRGCGARARAAPPRAGAAPTRQARWSTETAGRERGADGGAGSELRRAGDETGRDCRAEDAETEQRQRASMIDERILDRRLIAAEPLRELAEQRRADADDDGEHQDLDAGGDDIAQHLLGQEGGLVEQRERDQHEARKRRQFEFDQGRRRAARPA